MTNLPAPEFGAPVGTKDEVRATLLHAALTAPYPVGIDGPCVTQDPEDDLLVLRGTDRFTEGTPYLYWDMLEGDIWGWVLTVAGLEGMNIATAHWEDEPTIRSLVELMGDRDALISMASLQDSNQVARLTAIMHAVELDNSGAIPSMRTDDIRATLLAGGIQPPFGLGIKEPFLESWRASVRYLEVKTLTYHPITVAVCINAPHNTNRYTTRKDLSPFEGPDGIALMEQVNQARREWVIQASSAFMRAGWQILHLPMFDDPAHGFWATRLTDDQWEKVAPEAVPEAVWVEFSEAEPL